MPQLVILIIVIAVMFIAIRRKRFADKSVEEGGDKWKYEYKKKPFFLSRPEHECYDALVEVVGHEYYVFAQVHLPTLVEHKIMGQNWHGAFRHIDEKSVDFVLCDKAYIAPRLAIELDDSTHERPDRQERDKEVERILIQAGLPLLRLTNRGRFNSDELSSKIKDAITPPPRSVSF